ncbi:MAG: acyl carrier protein [Planctomycetes bacterium]|nr:acyl carrier protein [Planctomycetota bacterium]
MTKSEIKEQVKEFLFNFIQKTEVNEEEDLFASGMINSLFAMQLVLFIEKEFSLKVENEDLDYENFKSIVAITDFIGGKLEIE